jgi:hypothetical protein
VDVPPESASIVNVVAIPDKLEPSPWNEPLNEPLNSPSPVDANEAVVASSA